MTMGATGMGDMHQMELPDNSISMLGGDGPFGLIDMGGMFTVLKVRKQLTGDKDPGWYEHPYMKAFLCSLSFVAACGGGSSQPSTTPPAVDRGATSRSQITGLAN